MINFHTDHDVNSDAAHYMKLYESLQRFVEAFFNSSVILPHLGMHVFSMYTVQLAL